MFQDISICSFENSTKDRLIIYLFVAPGGSILEEGEKATWKTSVCIFDANDDDVKTYVQV